MRKFLIHHLLIIMKKQCVFCILNSFSLEACCEHPEPDKSFASNFSNCPSKAFLLQLCSPWSQEGGQLSGGQHNHTTAPQTGWRAFCITYSTTAPAEVAHLPGAAAMKLPIACTALEQPALEVTDHPSLTQARRHKKIDLPNMVSPLSFVLLHWISFFPFPRCQKMLAGELPRDYNPLPSLDNAIRTRSRDDIFC